jgi:hypothetical protein
VISGCALNGVSCCAGFPNTVLVVIVLSVRQANYPIEGRGHSKGYKTSIISGDGYSFINSSIQQFHIHRPSSEIPGEACIDRLLLSFCLERAALKVLE